MGRLTQIIPFPRRVQLGDSLFRVGELRLIDLAELQAALDDRQPDHVAEVLPKLDNADEETRRQLLAECYERVASEQPTIWDEQGTEWLCSLEGLATLLFIALRRFNTVDAARCVEIASGMDAFQFLTLRRIAFGSNPLKIVERLLGCVGRPNGPRVSWVEVVAWIAETYGTADLDVIYRRTLTEISALRSGGKPAELEEGRPLDEDEDAVKAAREQYRRFYGTEMPEAPTEAN